MSTLIILVILLFGFYTGPDCTFAPFKMWVQVEFGYYCFNLVTVYLYYRHLVNTNRESLKFLIFNCFLNVVHTAWLIYGNVIFWPNYAVCGHELSKSNGANINWVMGFLIVLGFITMCKCFTVSIVFLCFAPQILRAYRYRNRPDGAWVPTHRDLMKKMIKGKYKDGEHDDKECTICMEEYMPNDEITPLPCDARHYFHSKCIENWLKSNNSCPLCKKPITEEDLKN